MGGPMTNLDRTLDDLAHALVKARGQPPGLTRDVTSCTMAYVIGDLLRIKLIPQISEEEEYDLDLSAERLTNDILARPGLLESASGEVGDLAA